VQRWRVGVQREVGSHMVIEASYWGQWADRLSISQKLDYLPGQYWATGNVRNNALATALNANVTNPFYIGNFESIKTSDPVLYQQMSTLGQYTSTTIAKNRLLRAFPQMNGLNNNTDATGKARTHALEINFNRRFAKGFQVVQRLDRSVVFKVVPASGDQLPERETRMLREYAERYLPGVPLTIEVVDEIPATAAGKRHPVVVER